MADKISRRSFLKGTGKTILTAGALSSGIGLSTSTTPTTVVPKVMTWKNLNVLTPKAKAYRSYLKGMRGIAGKNSGKMKSVLTHQRVSMGIKAVTGRSLARYAFEHSISKGDQVGSQKVRGKYSLASDIVAKKIAPYPRPDGKGYTLDKGLHNLGVKRTAQLRRLSQTLHATGRTLLAKELRKRRKMRADLVKRGLVDKRKNTKMKGGGGGGGKGALPGSQSAKNPTGMSLITQRYTL